MSGPRVSVQLCTYNRGALLDLCLDALARQTAPSADYEVVVVDDGSTDDTAARLAARRDPFATVALTVPHGGLAAARNVGIRATRGEVVLFLDDDELAAPELVARHDAAHRRHSRAVVSGWVNHVASPDDPGGRRRLADRSTSFFWTSNVSVRRADLLEAGLFDTDFNEYGWEDVEFGERLRRLGLVRRYDHAAAVRHVKGPWRRDEMPARLAQAEASGRMAVVFVGKQPTWRARQATGITGWRRALNRWLGAAEPWCRRRIERAPAGPLRRRDFVAAYVWQRIAYFRSVERALAARGTP